MTRRGIGVSPGIAIGPALVAERHRLMVPRRQVGAGEVAAERARLGRAVEAARGQIRALIARLTEPGDDQRRHILEAQLLMLEDDDLAGEAERTVEREGVNAEWALEQVVERLERRFAALGVEHLRERAR